jgi:aminopeptidase N
MLRGQIGSDKFWEGIRLYYKRFRDSNASTDDFRQVMEEVSGQDLGWWFRQWLYRAGSPKIEGSWRFEPGRVVLEIEQTQPGEAYRLPLEVLGSKLEMTQKRQQFVVSTGAAPDAVTLDPNTWVLADFSRWESRGRR